jgi:ABC-type branched-subunit amino acid transport system substrate-binding protein
MRSKALAVAAVAAVAATAGACASDDDGSGASGGKGNPSFQLTIGALVPLTGDVGAFGPAGLKAAKLAVSDANAALKDAGLTKVQVTLKSADTQSAPQGALTAARQLAGQGANCFSGPWITPEAIPVLKAVTVPQRIPLISPSVTTDAFTALPKEGLGFRTAPPDGLQAQALAQLIAKELGGASDKTVSVGAQNNPYGQGLSDAFDQAWEQAGGTISGPVLYDPTGTNYDSEARKIVGGSPDAFVIIDFPETYAKVGAALLRTGKFDARKLFVVDGLGLDEIPKSIPAAALEGARGTRPGAPKSGPVVESFNQAFAAAPGPKQVGYDPQSYDATMLCVLGALAAGSNDGRSIADKVLAVSGPPGTAETPQSLAAAFKALAAGKDVDYNGPSGSVNLNKAGDPTTGTYDTYVLRGGKLEVTGQITLANKG